MSRELPILFSTEMVEAIKVEKKTQTRRLHDKPKYEVGDVLYVREKFRYAKAICTIFDNDFFTDVYSGVEFFADGWFLTDKGQQLHFFAFTLYPYDIGKWKPSIHMPKKYARIFLKVTKVWQERLHEITEEEALKEGFTSVVCPTCNGLREHGTMKCIDCYGTGDIEPALVNFVNVWNQLYTKEGEKWEDNPLVTVYEFERIEPK